MLCYISCLEIKNRAAAASLEFDCKGELHKVRAMSHVTGGFLWVTFSSLKALVRSFWLVIKRAEIVWATKANKTSGCKIDYFYNRYFQRLFKIASTGSVSNREKCSKQTRIAFTCLFYSKDLEWVTFLLSDTKLFLRCRTGSGQRWITKSPSLLAVPSRVAEVIVGYTGVSGHSM